jgi:hypothetical protein
MKKMFNYLLVGTMALGLFAAQSCTKTCDPGYEGSDCKTETRAKIIGKYKVTETCDTTGGASYFVDITKASDVQQVYVAPAGGYTGYTATLKNEGTALTLVSTTPSTGYTFSNFTGVVSTDGKTITASYKVSASGQSENCSGSWAKNN